MLAIAEPRVRPKAEHFYRPLRDGLAFCFISQHFVLGYFIESLRDKSSP
jgi:hypothetical protein